MKFKIAGIYTLLIIIILTGCTLSPNKNTSPGKETISVQTIQPQRQDMLNMYTATGALEALRMVEISSEITGRIKKLYVDEGDRVKAGMVIAEIEDSTQKAQLAQAEASLMKMKADWEKVKAGSRPQELSTAQQSVLEAKSTYEMVSTDYNRAKNLFEEGVASRQELDNAENQLKVKKTALQRAEENLSMVKEGVRKEDRDSVYASLQEAQAQVDYAQSQYTKTKIISPFDGVITARYKQTGDMVSAQPITNIFRVEQVNPIKAVLKIPQEDQFLIKVGQPISLNIRNGTTYTGKVSLISPAVDVQNRSVKIEALISNAENSLRPGVFVEGSILMGTHKQALTIPQKVLIQNAGDTTSKVFVVKNGTVHLVPIITGILQDSRIEIISGISEMDTIVVSGFDKISEGMNVGIVR